MRVLVTALKAIVFDFDGVIINSLKVHFATFQRIAKEFGKEYPVTMAEHGRHWQDWKTKFGEWGLQGKEFERGHRLLIDIYRELEQEVEFYAGIREVFLELKRKEIKIGIASNNTQETVQKFLKKFELEKLVDATVCGDEIRVLKPDPEMLNRCLQKLGVLPIESAYVGDMLSDIEAGKRAGTRTVAVSYGWQPKKMLETRHPDLIADNPVEILKIIRFAEPQPKKAKKQSNLKKTKDN